MNTFVNHLRTAMRRKNEGTFQNELTEDRVNRLNAMGFLWESKHPAKKKECKENLQFDTCYELLADFQQRYGHTQVSKLMILWRKGDEECPNNAFKRLPNFLASVRSEHEQYIEGKPCSLNEEKVRKLTELGLVWRRPGE